jgi:hypothetical protein
MGEIKSTLDLMMERTAGMGLSDEEKKRLKQEDLEKRAKGYKLKALAAPEAAQMQLQPLEAEPAEERETLKRLIWNMLVDELPADSSISDYLKVMEQLPQARDRQEQLARLREEIRSGEKGAKSDRKKILNRERKRLASAGISGSAVIAAMPRDAKEFTSLSKNIEALKKDLKNSP